MLSDKQFKLPIPPGSPGKIESHLLTDEEEDDKLQNPP